MKRERQITTIVGAQWGAEGKGKVVDYLAGKFDYVVRFHGGNNAGHTVVANGKTYKLHLLPSGVISPTATCVIGNGVVVDPKVLLGELRELKEAGITPKLKLSERAHIIMPYHIDMDIGLTESQGHLAAGSTKRGIAPVYADKAYRHGIRVGDLLVPELFKEKLIKSYTFNTQIINKLFRLPYERTIDDIYNEYIKYGEALTPHIGDTELELHQAFKSGKRVLFEGAQGMSLDVDHGLYPYGTSSNSVASYASVGSGLAFNCMARVIGIVKAYVSRVGQSPFVTELLDETGDIIREKGFEYGTTTGRPRRVGWLDLPQLRQAIRTSGLTEIALTKIDILGGHKEIPVCVAYDINGKRYNEMPSGLTEYKKARPIYEILSGFEDMTLEKWAATGKKGYQALPENLRKYVEFIEKNIGCPISLVSVGPDREATIEKEVSPAFR